MTLLADTHVLLWWLTDDRRLDPSAAQALDEGQFTVSVVTIWEIAVKDAAGRLPVHPDVLPVIQRLGLRIARVDEHDALAAARLPVHHRDPFDGMLFAQALRRGLVLATQDRAVRRYDVPVLPPREPDPAARV